MGCVHLKDLEAKKILRHALPLNLIILISFQAFLCQTHSASMGEG